MKELQEGKLGRQMTAMAIHEVHSVTEWYISLFAYNTPWMFLLLCMFLQWGTKKSAMFDLAWSRSRSSRTFDRGRFFRSAPLTDSLTGYKLGTTAPFQPHGTSSLCSSLFSEALDRWAFLCRAPSNIQFASAHPVNFFPSAKRHNCVLAVLD